MESFMTMVGKINTALWSNPMLFLAIGSGLIFTIALRAVQLRKIPTMLHLLFNGKSSDSGLSSFQAFTLAIAGRVGTGNIAGVATAICMGGPGAIFWMWVIAIVGSATTFVEASLSQLHKKKIDGEYKGGWSYYIGDRFYIFGGVTAVIFIVTMALTQTFVHSNAMSSAMNNAFGIPKIAIGIVVAILLAIILLGGVKRIGHVAEFVVPIMSVIYIIIAIAVLVVNYKSIPSAFGTIFSSAFGANQVIGAAMGSAMIWGTKRAIFSSETGMATATAPAASAEVSHPAKQGLVQAFSIYVDTLFICTATGLMVVVTGMYNVSDGNGGFLYTGLSEAIEAGPIWVQTAIGTLLPNFGPKFVGIAMFFFAFTTILNQCYSTSVYVSYFFQKKNNQPKWATPACYVVFIVSAIIGSVIAASSAWDLGDTGLGIIVWINYIFLLIGIPTAVALLKDFEKQQAEGKDPIFHAEEFVGKKGFETFEPSVWKEIAAGYEDGELKN